MCLQKFPPGVQIFQNLATGQLPKLPTYAYRNPPQFVDFPKSATGQILHVLAEMSSQFADFTKICHWTDTYMCLQKFLLGVQIFPNLPLDSYLSYLHVLAEIPPSLQIF